jgi:hypothetical protein
MDSRADAMEPLPFPNDQRSVHHLVFLNFDFLGGNMETWETWGQLSPGSPNV